VGEIWKILSATSLRRAADVEDLDLQPDDGEEVKGGTAISGGGEE
jgi:hypothetical protein